jgi:PAS domain S-box-containing protein
LAVLLVLRSLQPIFQGAPPLLLFLAATMLAAWYGGFRTGFFTTVASALAGAYFLVEPYGSLGVADTGERLHLGLLVGTGGMLSLVISLLRKAERRALHEALQREEWLKREMSERKQAEEELRQAHRLLDGAVNNTHLLMVCLDADFKFIWVNRAYAQACGREPEFFLGKNHFALYPYADNEAIFRRVVETGSPCFFEAKPFEFKDQPERGITYWDWGLIPVKGSTGQVERLVFTLLDVTVRMRAEQARHESEQRFRRLVEVSSQIVWVTNPQGEPIEDSPSWRAFTGRTYEQWIGWHWLEVIHPDDRQRLAEVWRNAVAAVGPYCAEFRMRHASGEYRHMAACAVPILNADGSVREWIGMNTDVTERKRAEEALRNADRRKDEFLAMLGHELRNPLAPIKNATHILKALDSPDPRLKTVQAILERQVGHLSQLVDDLLDVSRIVQGKISLRKTSLDLSIILDQALEASRPLIHSRRHELAVSVPDQPVPIHGDGVRLTQVVSNLLNNAAKYTPEGGRIWLEAEHQGGEAVIRVRDTGEGISQTLLAHIFDLFTQAGRTLDRSQGGLGLGLTIVKRLVELHGGRIEAYSEGVGKGSEFIVRLPTLNEPTASGEV